MLAAYFEWLLSPSEAAARFGCTFGALALELRALSDPATERAAGVVEAYFEAVSAQVRALHLPAAVADNLFITVQGAYAVARVKEDAALFKASVQRLQDLTAHVIGTVDIS